MNEAQRNECPAQQRVVRCPHSELVITETGDWKTEHSRSGGRWDHYNEPGGYTQKLDVRCCDCGYAAVHWRGETNMPKWLRDALEELGI